LGFQLGIFVLGEGVDSLRSCLETFLGVAVFVGETLAHGLVAIVGLVEHVNLCLQEVKLSKELAHKVAIGEGYSAVFSMLRDGMGEVVLNVRCSSSQLPLSSAGAARGERLIEPWSGCLKGVYTYALPGLLSLRLLAVVKAVLVVVKYLVYQI
jgi:hypothetical protein